MKNKYWSLIILLLTGFLQANAQFSETMGDIRANIPTRVKFYNNHIYVSGFRVVATKPYATFSCLDMNGQELWTTQLDSTSTPLDFEFITDEPGAEAAGFFLAGRTEPTLVGSTFQNNRSFIARIEPDGQVGWVNTYEQTGREGFSRITRHHGVGNNGLPSYFISGAINDEANQPSDFDRGVVWRMEGDGSITNRWIYTEPGVDDSELGLRIIPWGNQTLLVGGNRVDSGTRFGTLHTINTTTGDVQMAFRLPDNQMLQDIYRMNDGSLIISGFIPGTTNCFLARLNGTSFAREWWVEINNQTSFYEIGSDNGGNIYTVGRDVTQGFTINKFKTSTSQAFLLSSRRIIATGDVNFTEGHLWVRPNWNNLLYSDSRIVGINGGFGTFDIHIGVHDQELSDLDSCKQNTDKVLTNQAFDIVNLTVDKEDAPIPAAVPWTGTFIPYNTMFYCSAPPQVCCTSVHTAPGLESCDLSRLIFSPSDCTVEMVGIQVSGGTIEQSTLFTSNCGTMIQSQCAGTASCNIPNPGCFFNSIVTEFNTTPGVPLVVTYTVHFVGTTETCTYVDTLECCCPELKASAATDGTVTVLQANNCNSQFWNIQINLSGGSFVQGSITNGGGCLNVPAVYGGSTQVTLPVLCTSLNPFNFQVTATTPGAPVQYSITTFRDNDTCSTITGSILIPDNCDTICDADIKIRLFRCPGDFEHLRIDVCNNSNNNLEICNITTSAANLDWSLCNVITTGFVAGSFSSCSGGTSIFEPASGALIPGACARLELYFPRDPGFMGPVSVQVNFCGAVCGKQVTWDPEFADNGSDIELKSISPSFTQIHTAAFRFEPANTPGNRPVRYFSLHLPESVNSEIIAVTGASGPCGGGGLVLSKSSHDAENTLFELPEGMDLSNLDQSPLHIIFAGNRPEKLDIILYAEDGSIIYEGEVKILNIATGINEAPKNSAQWSVYPNPAHTTVHLMGTLSHETDAPIRILNAVGKVVQVLDMGHLDKGVHHFTLDIAAYPPGIYWINNTTGQTSKMVVIRP